MELYYQVEMIFIIQKDCNQKNFFKKKKLKKLLQLFLKKFLFWNLYVFNL